MSLLAASLIVGVLLAEPAPLEAVGEVVCTGSLPFSAEEVNEALFPRWHLLGGAAVVGVRAERGRTLVKVGAAEREVDLGGRTGEEAARLVAIVALDLAQDRGSFAVSSGPPPASVSASASPEPKQTRPSRSGRAFRMGLSVLSPFDQSGVIARAEPTFGAAFDLARGFGAFLTAGFRRASTTDAGTSVVLRELPVRAGAAFRLPWLELRAGGLARSRFVEGPRSYRGVAWGAAISVATRLALSPRLALELAGGFDIFRTRMVFAVNEDVFLTTPWLSPWLGAGLAWETVL